MSIRDSRRSSRALVLAGILAFTAFPALAMPGDGASRRNEGRGSFMTLMDTLRSVWLGVWGEEGMSIDPDGRPGIPKMINILGNEGMSIDPDGRPAANPTTPGEWTNTVRLRSRLRRDPHPLPHPHPTRTHTHPGEGRRHPKAEAEREVVPPLPFGVDGGGRTGRGLGGEGQAKTRSSSMISKIAGKYRIETSISRRAPGVERVRAKPKQ